MLLEEKIKVYKAIQRQIEELETQRKAIVAEILQIMPQETKIMRVADYNVRRVVRLSIRTSLEDARHLKVTKLQEVIDKEKIKRLVELGETIPGVSELRFIQVSSVPQAPEISPQIH